MRGINIFDDGKNLLSDAYNDTGRPMTDPHGPVVTGYSIFIDKKMVFSYLQVCKGD